MALFLLSVAIGLVIGILSLWLLHSWEPKLPHNPASYPKRHI